MALRLIELILPEDQKKYLQELLKDRQLLGIWYEKLLEDRILVRILLPAEETEALMDIFEKHFSTVDGFRIILFPVEATVPRPEQAEEEKPEIIEIPPEQPPEKKIGRISREELYSDIEDSAKISKTYIIMVALSSIVAAIGLLRGNVAIIIGAMVIAPLIGANVALSLATTLGDGILARNSLKTNMIGIITALIFSILLGHIFNINPNSHEIVSRTEVGIEDVTLALAAGSAGALAFTTGIPTILIGVMVAVSLLPPLVTFGMLIGAGYMQKAFGAMLLFFTNIICINLAGVITFLLQGIHPITWWEANRAKKATLIAIMIWIFLLFSLLFIIFLAKRT
jgi:uncharacterized hydrophobic protein (TIGR00341 family)